MLTAAILWFLKDALFFFSYVSGRSSFPKPLSPVLEQEALQKMFAGDTAARGTLVEHNLRLVAHIAKKYTAAGHDSDDLISIGTIGLIKGVSTFKPDNGTQLATYCARCIENEILMTLRASKKQRYDVSLTDPIGTDRSGNEIMLIDILGTESDLVLSEVDSRIEIGRVREIIQKHLDAREKVVIQLRYGLLDGKPRAQREIAKLLDISRSYVSRIEKHAIERIRKQLENT